MVSLGKSAYTKIYARQIQPFSRPQFTAHQDPTQNIFICNGHNFQLNKSIIEKQRVSGLYSSRESIKRN